MTVQDAFRVARGAGGVAERTGGFLVEIRPGIVAGALLQQIFIAQQVVDTGVRWHVGLIGHGDERLDRMAAASDELDQRQEGHVEEDVLVFGMIGDVGHLVFMQARVDGMHDGTHAADAVVQLQVTIAVPGKRSDAVGRLHAQAGQGAGQLVRATVAVTEGVAMDIALHPAGHNLSIAMMAVGVFYQRGNQQLLVHHQAMHGHRSVHKSEIGERTGFSVRFHVKTANRDSLFSSPGCFAIRLLSRLPLEWRDAGSSPGTWIN
ncbi:hypothetical protein EMIT0P218_30089 [Pseudomonas sp. IT-P218]